MRGVKGFDPVRAWRFLRASKGYRAAWRQRRPLQGLAEPAPFDLRWQTEADQGALPWGLLAWEDPYALDGPLSPFWDCAAMFDGRMERGAVPLAPLAVPGRTELTGLRVAEALILKIERPGAAVQVRIPGAEAFPEDGSLLLVREVAEIEDVWSAAPSPLLGWGTGTKNFCSCWNARPEGCRAARSQWQSGVRTGSMPSTTPAAGCNRGSSAGWTVRRRF